MEDKQLIASLIFSLPFIFIMMSMPVIYVMDVEVEHSIYQMQAPFGFIVSTGEGHWIWGSGSMSIEPAEAYVIKYVAGNQLKTVVLDAVQNPIVIDGTLKLVEVKGMYKSIWGNATSLRTSGYVLHIPYLPNQTRIGTEYWSEP